MLNYGVRRGAHPAWGFKDPRSGLFLPQWNRVFPDMSLLYIYRPCIESVHSLKRRAARDLMRDIAPDINQRFWSVDDLAVRMYLVYARSALRALEFFQGRVCVVSLDSILSGRNIVDEVRTHWHYPFRDTSIRDIYDSQAMVRSGPNELLFDQSLLPQIEDIETKFLDWENRGFVEGSVKKVRRMIEA